MSAMHTKAIPFVIAALFASVASGQTSADQGLDRVFYFSNAATAQSLQEIATVMRVITGVRQISTQTAQRTLALRGTADEIALADWLVKEMDKPTKGAPQDAPEHEYRTPGNSDDVVRVFHLAHVDTPRGLQEVATIIRTVTEIRRLMTYNASKAMTLRGTAEQIALAEWLVNELDRPANRPPIGQGQDAATHEYRVPGRSDDVVRVFYLTHVDTPQGLQETATLIRTVTKAHRLLTYTTPMAVALRGTADQMALAERLIQERDKR